MTADEFERLREALEQLRVALGPGDNSVSVDGYGIEVVVQEDGRGLVLRIHFGDD